MRHFSCQIADFGSWPAVTGSARLALACAVSLAFVIGVSPGATAQVSDPADGADGADAAEATDEAEGVETEAEDTEDTENTEDTEEEAFGGIETIRVSAERRSSRL